LRLGVLALKKPNAKPQSRQGAPTGTPIRSRTGAARYEEAMKGICDKPAARWWRCLTAWSWEKPLEKPRQKILKNR